LAHEIREMRLTRPGMIIGMPEVVGGSHGVLATEAQRHGAQIWIQRLRVFRILVSIKPERPTGDLQISDYPSILIRMNPNSDNQKYYSP